MISNAFEIFIHLIFYSISYINSVNYKSNKYCIFWLVAKLEERSSGTDVSHAVQGPGAHQVWRGRTYTKKEGQSLFKNNLLICQWRIYHYINQMHVKTVIEELATKFK